MTTSIKVASIHYYCKVSFFNHCMEFSSLQPYNYYNGKLMGRVASYAPAAVDCMKNGLLSKKNSSGVQYFDKKTKRGQLDSKCILVEPFIGIW